MKNLYSSELTKTSYDAIIIGSGVGGLTTAVFLAKAGKKVLVLEKHYTAGGFTHTFKRKKYEWDVGAHYMGQMNDPKALLRRIFDYTTDGKLKWDDIGEIYDQAIIEGSTYNFRKGLTSQVNQMIAYFPEEEKAIRAYYQLVLKVSSAASLFFSEKTMPTWLSWSLGGMLKKSFLRYSGQTTEEVLNGLTTNKKLIAVLCAQCGNYGLTPRYSSFGIHALVVAHYLDGASYPAGGPATIFKSMSAVIEAHQGIIAIKADVKHIIIKDNTATGVMMQNGDILHAKTIISNTGAHNTFNKLIPKEFQKEENTRELNILKPSISHVCLYVGLNASDEELKLPKHNLWIYENYALDVSLETHLNKKNSASPFFYISFPSAKDSRWKETHPDISTIQVLASYPFEWIEAWENERWQKRGEEYSKIKEDLKSLFLEKLYSVLPQIKGHVEVCEISTPLSTRHFSNYNKGEIYGLEHTPQRFRLKQLRPKTNYKNLYITGQDVTTVGVCSALFSGVVTSVSVLNRNLLWRVHKHKLKD